MSERTDDPTHSEYRWTDHEAELHRQQQSNQSGSTSNLFSPTDGQYKVPDLPPGVDLDANVKEAQRMFKHNIEQGFRYYDDNYNEGVDHTTRE